MYECVYGRRPFRHKKSADELKRALLQEEIQFPIIADVQVSYDCISAMRGFLHKDPAVRLGCGPAGLAAVKAHPFFASINWPVLEAKRADPPFVPNPEQSNFDISHDLEEMLLEPEPLDAKKRIAMKRHKTPPEHACPEYHEITRAFAAFDYIEYERFKTYIETHGAITADDSAIAVSNTVLASVRLDGRPIFPPLDSRRSNSRASTAHIASRNSVNAATASTSSPDAPPRIATSILAISPNSTTTTSSSSTTTTMSTPVAAVATTADGTLEPPPIVPIDILLWNQLLPEQRSLAHRFCIKMAHDRQRHQHQQQLSRIGTSCSSSSPPPPASAVGNTFSQQHLRHPHRHYLVPTSASSLAVTGLSHTFSSHHVQQKQQNQQMPRPQPPQLPHISTSICLGEERQPATDGFFALREKRQSIIKRQRSADNLPCISHSLLPPPNIDDDDDLHRRHYQHQPLPQLPNLAPSQPL
ncbi:hypothetical protein EV174_004333 [Coemansia sp. RSA 2320]|nr:hypothetical protein EV174_004333 [Coemansia sp. RSA 2320]